MLPEVSLTATESNQYERRSEQLISLMSTDNDGIRLDWYPDVLRKW
jgi:hypothetical protein